MTSLIGKIERISLRKVWKNEARDFTTWLQGRIEIVGEAVGLEFDKDSVRREQQAGDFRVDLVAKYGKGDIAIIENQLEKSDHDHLGKVITYLVALEAKTAIWIASDPRPEHIAAITWLNESSSADFYLLKFEAVKIGFKESENSETKYSVAAPLVTLIVGPSEEGKGVGRIKQELTEHGALLKRFWTGLLKQVKDITGLHPAISPSPYEWIGTGAGIAGLAYNYVIRKNDAQVELYIDRGKESDDENRKIFEQLKNNQAKIESDFGESLEWQDHEGVRACRICKAISSGGWSNDESEWSSLHKEMIDAMVRLEKALSPFIREIKI